MPFANSGGVKLHYQEVGQGTPILFVHEMGSDIRQWEQQLRWFGQRFRCIAYDARGYLPSDVPPNDADYTYDRFVGDIGAVLDHCGVERAHLIGWSMGAYASLVFGLQNAARCLSLTLTGVGSGSPPHEHAHFGQMMVGLNALYLEKGAAHCAELLSNGTTRIQLKRKDPRGWEAFRRDLAEHSAEGMARTCLNFQGKRPSLTTFEAELKACRLPVLLVCGDEDSTCVETNIYLKRMLPGAGLWMIPKTGHAPNLEDPGGYNRGVHDFLDAVERGVWEIKASSG